MKRKKTLWIVLAACLLALALLAGLLIWNHRSRPVVTCGGFSLSNTELGYYYWSEYFYFAQAYGDYLDGMVDLSQPLDQQAYDEERSWQDYLLSEALSVVRETMSMVFEARDAGFVLPEDYAASLETVLDSFQSAADAGGHASLEDYLRASYGRDASVESFREYLYCAHLASAWSDHLADSFDPSEAEIADYFDRHAGEYLEHFGVTRDDGPMAQAVIQSYADRDKAQSVYDEFLENGGTREVLDTLGTIHCGETGEREAVEPEMAGKNAMIWLSDTARQPGDSAVVEEDDGSAWVLYYIGSSGRIYWQELARDDLCRDLYQNAFRTACDRYTFLVDYDAIQLTPPAGLYENNERE